MNAALIFDGDDTLWVTEPLYDEARRRAAAAVTAAGFDAAAWEELQRTQDVANVARFGMSSQRFPTSCVEALDTLAHAAGCDVPDGVRDAVWHAAASVFAVAAPLVPGATETLDRVVDLYQLALLTKGDADVQRKRIDDSGLADYFEVIQVVPHKDAQTFRAMRAALRADAVPCWSIGNSLTSDVLPAIEAGLRAIWVDAHVWEYERREAPVPSGVVVADALVDIPNLVERALAAAPAT